MESEKLFKKGTTTKGDDGTLLLVNEDNNTFSVNEAIIMIWNMCNGISFSELVTSLATDTGKDANQLKSSLESLVNELRQVKLLEVRQ